MRRFTMISCLLVLASLTVTTAWGQSPHYLRANASVSNTTACLNVTFKEAGLGNAATSVDYTLSCSSVSYTVECRTKNGNTVQGQPKSGTTSAQTGGSFPVRNGSASGTISLCPSDAQALPDPGCTGSQREFLTAASYDGCSLADAFGTASPIAPGTYSATGLNIEIQ